MLEIARTVLAQTTTQNLHFREGQAEALPFDDASFDLVISDGVLNLVTDKDAAFKQIVRVLWPGEDLMAQTLLSLKASRPILWRARMRGLLELRVPCRVSLTWPSSRRLVFSPPKSG